MTTTPPHSKYVFISYSHDDRTFVDTLADRLRSEGVRLWQDRWEIAPGDSIVRKIFEEGLANCEVFVLVLSKSSVASKWVREELDVANLRRIQEITKVVPVLKEDCEIPESLRHLMWVDMRDDFDAGVRLIRNVAYGVYEKPPLGPVPDDLVHLSVSVGGLSQYASTVGLLLKHLDDPDEGVPRFHGADEIAEHLSFGAQELNDAIDELEENGLIEVRRYLGPSQYDFAYVNATYALYLHFRDSLTYDPEQDIATVAAAVSALDKAGAQDIQARTQLSPGRLNRAVKYLDDYGLARVHKWLGTAPFTFGEVWATRHTRELVRD